MSTAPQHDAPFATAEAAFDYKQLVVHPLSDVHIGAHKHDVRRFKDRISSIAKAPPHHRVILLGDLADTQVPTSKHFEVGNTMFREEIDRLAEALSPIAGRIDLLLDGNHERRLTRFGLRPMGELAAKLNIGHRYTEVTTVLRYSFAKEARSPNEKRGGEWRYRGRCEIFCHHGYGGGRGPKIGKCKALAAMKPDCHAYLMGHVHGHETDFDEIPIGWPIKRRRRFYCVTGTYLDSERYAVDQGYAAGAVNSPELVIDFDATREDAVVHAITGRHR